MANFTLVLRGQKLISPGDGECENHPLVSCPFIFACGWQPLAPPTASLFLPTPRLWLSLASLVYCVRKLCPFWEDNSRRERNAWFSGFLGSRDVFVFVYAYASHWTMDGEVRNQTQLLAYLFAEIESGWGSTAKVMACQRGRKGILLNGNWGKGVKWRVCVLVTQCLSTSSLGSCNHTRSVAGCWCVLQSSPSFPGL